MKFTRLVCSIYYTPIIWLYNLYYSSTKSVLIYCIQGWLTMPLILFKSQNWEIPYASLLPNTHSENMEREAKNKSLAQDHTALMSVMGPELRNMMQSILLWEQLYCKPHCGGFILYSLFSLCELELHFPQSHSLTIFSLDLAQKEVCERFGRQKQSSRH